MNRHRRVLWVGLLLLVACSEEDKARTREEFCRDWADAACSKEVVSACQATDSGECRQTQEDFCRELVPEAFSDAKGDACIDAVEAAYEDADLKGDELATVLKLAAPCDQIIKGSKDAGDSCTTRNECDAAAGFDCVRKAGSAEGTCQEPEQVGAGRDCEAEQKVCGTGFFCDGSNCVEARDVGEDCTIPEECGTAGYCGEAGKCETRLKVNDPCTSDAQCATGICYEFEGETTCTDRIRLSRSEPICDDLQ